MLSQLSPNSQVTSRITPPSAVAASATAPVPVATTAAAAPIGTATPTATATATPGPAALTGASAHKRPAAFDLQRITHSSATPSKRRATGSGIRGARSALNPSGASGASGLDPSIIFQPQLYFQPASTPAPASAVMAAPAPVTEDQLHGRTPEQLIATILQLQDQHQQFMVQIHAQYENINLQLNELRGSLIASHQAAASALSTREQPVRSVVPPPPTPLQQTAVPPPPRPPIQTPTRAAPRVPRASPSHHAVPRSTVTASTPTAAAPPQYEYRTVNTVDEVWKEYRQGMDGQPAVEYLDATWGSRWRPEPRGRTWYSRRKVIWDKIKEFMSDGMDEEAAVQEVEKLREGGTINKLIRMLQDERKDKGMGDDGLAG